MMQETSRTEKNETLSIPRETVRDVMALVAMLPLIHAYRKTYKLGESGAEEIASDAYRIADAMLKARGGP